MTGFGARGLLVLLAVVLFIISALGSEDRWDEFISFGLAVFAAAFIVDSLPLGNMTGTRRTTDRT
jgi:hypothetical protein